MSETSTNERTFTFAEIDEMDTFLFNRLHEWQVATGTYNKNVISYSEYSVGGDCVIFSGDEYWRFGGHESHSFTLPAAAIDNFDAALAAELERQARVKVAEEEKKRIAAEKRAVKDAERKQSELTKLARELGYTLVSSVDDTEDGAGT